MPDDTSYASDVQQALEVVRDLARSGVPIFLLEPTSDPKYKTGYKPPSAWQHTVPDPSVADRWTPGMAIAALCGTVYDVIDVDVQNHGTIDSFDGILPHVYAKTDTPSGGTHYWIKTLGVHTSKPFPGVDLQAGIGGSGHGFVFLPPTERASKVDGVVRPYVWSHRPPEAMTPGYMADESGLLLTEKVRTARKAVLSSAEESYSSEVDGYLRDGIPMGQQQYVLTRIAFDMVVRGQGDLHIMFTMRAILSRSQQDMTYPWTDSDLQYMIDTARSKAGPTFQTEFATITWGMLDKTRISEVFDPTYEEINNEIKKLKKQTEAKRIHADAEAAKLWKGWDESESLNLALADEDAVKLDYMFGELVSKDDNVLLAAKFKTGKTTMLGSFIKSILDGTPFLNKFNVHDDVYDMRVGIWNCEMTRVGFLNYLRKSDIRNGNRAELNNLRGCPVPFLSNSKAREETVNWLAENDIKVWVIDSWSVLCTWNKIDMNDNSEVMRLCVELDNIKREAGVRSIIMSAHSPKNQLEGEESAIGAQNLSGWADTIMMLIRDKDNRFVWTRGRCDYELPETQVMRNDDTNLIELGEGSREEHREHKKQEAKDIQTEVKKIGARESVLEFVKANPGCIKRDIRTISHYSKDIIEQVLQELISDGSITIVMGSRRALHHYVTGSQPE